MNNFNDVDNLRFGMTREVALNAVRRRYGDGISGAFARGSNAVYGAASDSSGTGVVYDEDGEAVSFWRAGMSVGSAPIRGN